MTQQVISVLLTFAVMSAITLAILLFNALFPKIFTSKLRYAIWLIVLVGLIIPLRPVIGDGLVTVPIPAAQTQSIDTDSPPISETLLEADTTQGGEVTESASAGGLSPVTVFLLVWGIVAALIFTVHIWRYACFIRTIKRWGVQAKDEKILSVFQNVRSEMGLSDKKIDVKICGFIGSSMLTGFFRPVILLPDKPFDADELELIFKHELIHYKHHDLYIKLLAVIAVSLHWFNPLVYWMSAALQADGEAACDEAVLQNADKESRQFYAEVIIGMIGGKPQTMLSTCFYGGKSRIKKRLDYIMDTTRKIQKPAVMVLAAVIALTVLSGSVFALAQTHPEVQATPSAASAPETTVPAGITMERAEEIALATVGGGTVTYCERTFEAGREVFKITVIYGDKTYSMSIDAIDASLTNYQVDGIEQAQVTAPTETQTPEDTPAPSSSDPVLPNTPKPDTTTSPVAVEPSPSSTPPPATPQTETTSPPQQTNTEITAERAKEIALTKVGGGTVTECKLDYENGRKVYEIKIVYGNTKYEMDVDAIDGSISDYSAEARERDDDDDHD